MIKKFYQIAFEDLTEESRKEKINSNPFNFSSKSFFNLTEEELVHLEEAKYGKKEDEIQKFEDFINIWNSPENKEEFKSELKRKDNNYECEYSWIDYDGISHSYIVRIGIFLIGKNEENKFRSECIGYL